ncbi:MAG: hypothetical protein N2449_05180 [Bacteroidales bacterium]|nr:hypothetical protein [Bacteroidales bacterium]
MNHSCQNCGGHLQYVPASTTLKCIHCHTVYAFEQQNNPIEWHNINDNHNEKSQPVSNLVLCNSCGANFSHSQYIPKACPFCSSNINLNDIHSHNIYEFDAIIPFNIEKETAKTNIKQWMRRIYLAPNSFVKQFRKLENIEPTYIPYWIVKTKTKVNYQIKCGIKSIFSKKISWTTIKGESDIQIKHLAILSTDVIPNYFIDPSIPTFDEIIIEPWNNQWDFNNEVKFNQLYTLGYSILLPQKDIVKSFNENSAKVKQLLEENICSKYEKQECDQTIVKSISYEHKEVFYHLAFLPVWISAYKYKGKIYQILVNGQTGQVVGNRPTSILKIIFLWIFVIFVIIIGLIIIAMELYGLLILIIGIPLIFTLKNTNHGKRL